MLYKNSFVCEKVMLISLLLVMVVGCGGGRASTSATDNAATDTSVALGSAELSWLPPTEYTDNSSLSPAGHNIYIDDGSGYTKLITINNPSVTAYIVENLSAGSYKFVITAFDTDGVESAFSNEANVTI